MNKIFKYIYKLFQKEFFYSKLNKIVLGLSLVIVIIIILYTSSFRPVQVFPSNKNFNFTFFTDTANNGNSVITNYSISDSLVELDYILKQGFIDPYVSISISNKQDALINLKYYNQLIIDLEGFNTENVGFDIYMPFSSQPGKFFTYYYNILDIKAERKEYEINFQDLKIPNYWFEANNFNESEKLKANFEEVSHFNIGTAYTTAFDISRKLRIYKIAFQRDNTKLIFLLLVCEITIIILLVLVNFIRSKKDILNNKISIIYKPVEFLKVNKINDDGILEKELEECLNYINLNFKNPDISIENVGFHFRISKNHISKMIQSRFNCNFKSYINKLRIHESKKLLKETDLSIGEVAYSVGFNTQSHFNRVFKSIERMNPTSYKSVDF